MAVKGLIILSVAVALCMFFAGTVRTIVTPKIKIVSAKTGKLEQSISLKGVLTHPETEEVRVDDARGQTLSVSRVYVRAGHEVKAGEVMFEMEMTDYDEKNDKLVKDYEDKRKKLIDLDIKNRELNKTNPRNSAYDAMILAHKALIEAKVKYQALREQEGLRVPGDVKNADLQQYLVDNGGSPALGLAAAAYAEAASAATRAENTLFSMLSDKKTKGKDGIWEYLKERSLMTAELEQVEKDMTELAVKKSGLSKVIAPRDAYVTAVSVKPGDAYEGKTAALSISKEGVKPVLRADITDVRQSIDTGAAVLVKGDWQALETKVIGVGVDIKGRKYVDVELTEEIISMRGGVYAMTLSDTDMTVTFRAKESRTLLPASAVRSGGEKDDYVWQIRREYGGFTGERMKIAKTPVTVVQRADKVVAIAEDMYNAQIADMEDRAIKDGDAVMEYVS